MTERHQNKLSLGPNFKYFRLLKALVIRDSQVPNIGIRTLWGLSGLRLLDLSRNRLTNVIDKNFDGLYRKVPSSLCLKRKMFNKVFYYSYIAKS